MTLVDQPSFGSSLGSFVDDATTPEPVTDDDYGREEGMASGFTTDESELGVVEAEMEAELDRSSEVEDDYLPAAKRFRHN